MRQSGYSICIHISVLLAILLGGSLPLSANLPSCSVSCGICACRGGGGGRGPGAARSLLPEAGRLPGAPEGEPYMPLTGHAPHPVPGGGRASGDGFSMAVDFGRAAWGDLELAGQFSVHAQAPSPLLATVQYLQYRNWLLDRILQTEVATAYAPSILGGDWEDRLDTFSVYGRVTAEDTMGEGVTHQVRILQEKREAVIFRFTQGNATGVPAGDHSTLGQVLVMLDSSGAETTSLPAYYELRFGSGDSVRYAASDGKVVSVTTATGRTVTPADAGLEAIYDGSGLLRQVRSDADGLADIVPLEDTPGYELRFYALSQISGQADGIYTVTGSPHTVWRLSASGDASTVLVTRINGVTEETSRFEYSHNSEGWMETGADSRTVTSMTSSWDPSLTTRTMTAVEKTSTGTVASKRTSVVRKYPFGERTVVTTADPDGAHLVTAYTYYDDPADGGSYGRQKTESRPDGGWTAWRYDAQGRVAAVVTPWKNAAFNSSDAEAKVALYSYSPVDGRDAVAATDTRPRVEETRILGVTTSKTYHAYYKENGCCVEVLERCVRPDAAYGDSGSLRTVWRYYPGGAASSSVSAGLLHTVSYPGGVIDTIAYEKGTWTPGLDDSTPGTFTPGNGHALRVTSTRGTARHPDGIAFRTLRTVSVRDSSGNAVMSENQVYSGSGFERIGWTSCVFDELGRMTRQYQSSGELTETAWNCCARASETLSDGRTYLYEYDALKRLVTTTLRGSGSQPDYVTGYAYDAAGHVTATAVSGGGLSLSSTSAYDHAGRLVQSADFIGLTETRSYLNGVNAGGQRHGGRMTVTNPGGSETTVSSYCDGRQESVTGNAQMSEYYDYGVNADGTQWTLVHFGGGDSPRWTKTTTDMLGRTARTEKPGYGGNAVVVQQNFYDNAGRLVRTTQTGQADMLYEYDGLGSLVRTGQDADGSGTLDLASNDRITETASVYFKDNSSAWWERSTQRIYATANNATPTVVSVTEERLSGFASGIISETHGTDIHGNTTVSTTVSTTAVNRAAKTVTAEVRSPDSTAAEQQVKVNGLVTSVRSKSNLTTTFGYDGLRRRISVTSPRAGTTVTAYHTARGKAGLVSSRTDAAGNATLFDYDPLTGLVSGETDAMGNKGYYLYNARGEIVRIWGDIEYPVEYSYDQYGQKISMTTYRTGTSWNGESWPNPAPQGDTTTWSYDAATGLLLAKADADGYGPSYTYTTDGKFASRTWARKDAQGNDLVTTYSYNAFGELTGIDYSDSTPDVTYAYNRFGKLSQVTDGAGTRTFAYNNTLDEVSETITGLYGKTLTRTYTSTGFKGKILGLSIDNVSNYAYGYDQYGRMDQITIPSGSFSYTRLPNSNLVSQMTRPNGITTTWSYETDRDLITQVQHGTVSTYGYVNDAIGRRSSMSRSGIAYVNGDTIDYSYNSRSELVEARSDSVSSYDFVNAYDPIGNRLSSAGGGVNHAFAANALNQYESISFGNDAVEPSYDLDGSMTYRPVDAASGWTQVWDGENRMVETHKGNDRLTFRYDYMGRRVEKCVYSGNTLTSKTLFVYDGFKCVEELDGLNNNAVAMRHAWQPFDVGLDVILATAAGNATFYFLHDASKNVMQKTSASGALLEEYDYSPFGESIGLHHGHFGFSSEYSEHLLGLVYYNYRYYAPVEGRWISRDPLGELAGLSLYAMLVNNPVGLYDMYGLGWNEWLADQDWIDPVANFSAGMGDRLSYGLTQKVRGLFGYDDAVDYGSGAYGYGRTAGTVLDTAINLASLGGLGRQLLQCHNKMEVARLLAMLEASKVTAWLEQMALDSLLSQAICGGYLSQREAEAIRMALEAAALVARYKGAWHSGQRRCFAAGMQVLMADGRFMPIEEIECGDSVLVCVDGENVSAEVTDVFRGETMEWVDIAVAGTVIRTTPGHLFRVGGEWVEARNLRAGMSLQDVYFAGQIITEVSIVCLTEPEPTYNLGIRVGHTFYVSEQALLVHNSCRAQNSSEAQNAMQRGRQNEKRALAELGLNKNTKPKADDITGYRTIPDAMDDQSLVEIKDVKELRWTRQIHAQENIAAKLGKKYTIYTGEKTYVPASFSNIDVQKRSFLGPQ